MSLYSPLFKVLNDAKVQYVVVDGLATVLHGYARLTADIDLVINLEPHEAEKAIRAILACGLKPRLPVDPMQVMDQAIREGWIKDKNMLVFSFYQPDNPLMILDVFVREPFPFKEVAQRAVPVDLGGIIIPVCAIHDLIAMKQQAARPKDLEDIKYLQGLLDKDDAT